MQRMSTPIFVGFRPAVYENECPSIHGVRESRHTVVCRAAQEAGA